MNVLFRGLLVSAALALSGCGYNTIQTNEQEVKASWAEVVNQYQRRSDLIPNLVASVKGYATQEQEVFTRVTEARSSIGSIKATPELLNDPAAFKKFNDAQGQLQGSLSRLMLVAENYPQLKSDTLFRDLSSQLEGTENRITVARNKFVKSVQKYNTDITTIPNNFTAMVMGYKEKPQFTVENEAAISKAPSVDFSKPAAPAQK
jgi:LemA protein